MLGKVFKGCGWGALGVERAATGQALPGGGPCTWWQGCRSGGTARSSSAPGGRGHLPAL
ncbi:MAG: hypothetical protein N2110_01335 [Flavobacteriales bacterium]|nr:hypothetical protein [Flavobacteriales bacterium]MCX7767653.1 hypothetical protein [Flavobacteriales bacterium]MDW8409505.1 hypothetical protein [Flavobacteriales bacterium]